jgi:hypothetical protein
MDTANLSGCAICFGEDAAAVWKHQRELKREAVVIDESHFMVRIAGCAACGQRFASLFFERINWTGDDDSMDSFLIPLTAGEAEALIAAGESGVERALHSLQGARRQLVSFFPRPEKRPDQSFVFGPISIPRHD